ncbi:MAG: urease accessory protein UreE [Janthinobacterium lividum]
MNVYTAIVGSIAEAAISNHIHLLEHAGKVDYLTLSADDVRRRRLRATSDEGVECGVALDRDVQLFDGAVLRLDPDAALVVRTRSAAWLDLLPCNMDAALELGYFAGNMHWKVQFHGKLLKIALKGPIDDYLARLQPLIHANRVAVRLHDASAAHD